MMDRVSPVSFIQTTKLNSSVDSPLCLLFVKKFSELKESLIPLRLISDIHITPGLIIDSSLIYGLRSVSKSFVHVSVDRSPVHLTILGTSLCESVVNRSRPYETGSQSGSLSWVTLLGFLFF